MLADLSVQVLDLRRDIHVAWRNTTQTAISEEVRHDDRKWTQALMQGAVTKAADEAVDEHDRRLLGHECTRWHEE